MNIPFSCFRVFDQNGDGNISRRELKNAMISFGQIFSAAEADEMFNVNIYFSFWTFLKARPCTFIQILFRFYPDFIQILSRAILL